jgi:hypothetical protein
MRSPIYRKMGTKSTQPNLNCGRISKHAIPSCLVGCASIKKRKQPKCCYFATRPSNLGAVPMAGSSLEILIILCLTTFSLLESAFITLSLCLLTVVLFAFLSRPLRLLGPYFHPISVSCYSRISPFNSYLLS